MEYEPSPTSSQSPTEELREFQKLLRTIVMRLTRLMFTTPRLTQIDVGNAMVLSQRVEYPKIIYARKVLPELLRELGKRRPDLRRHVVVLEQAVHDIDEHLAEPR